jgi:adenylate kinase
MGTFLDAVINIEVPDEILVERISGRRICRSCGATYNVNSKPSLKEGVCDICGGELYQRDDDCAETVQNRLAVYKKETAPLIEFYKNEKILRTIPGDIGLENVFGEIQKILEEAK